MSNNGKAIYSVVTAEQSFSCLEELYTPPETSIRQKIQIAACALFLYMLPMNPIPYSAQVDNAAINAMQQTEWLKENNGILVSFNQEDYCVVVKDVASDWQQKDVYKKLYDSFWANFDGIMNDNSERFFTVFQNMAHQLCKLQIKDVFVDVGIRKSLIDFNLLLEDGLFLSVARHLYEETDDVMFTIDRNERTLVIDVMPLKELMDKVLQIEAELKAVKQYS